MEDKFKIPVTPTGAHERVRLRRDDGGMILSGTIVQYDFVTGNFHALMDVQHIGELPFMFTAQASRIFTDSAFNLIWHLV